MIQGLAEYERLSDQVKATAGQAKTGARPFTAMGIEEIMPSSA